MFATVRGTRLSYVDEGSGPPVVWIHGYPLSGEIFRAQLAIPGYRHIVPDLRGFGASEPPDRMLTIDDYAHDVLALLDHLRIRSAVFAGLSMGGYVVFSILRMAAERALSLILIDTRETADTEQGREQRYEMIRNVEINGPQAATTAMRGKLLSTAGSDGESGKKLDAILHMATSDGIVAALRAMAERVDGSELLRDFAGPTMVIVGEEDQITPVRDAERMFAIARRAELAVIPGAGHLATMDRPDEVNAVVARFLDRSSGRNTALHESR